MKRLNGEPLGIEGVREGQIMFSPGPPDIQLGLDAGGDMGVGHVAIAIHERGQVRIVEAGPKGCKTRSLRAVVRRQGSVQIASLDLDAAEVDRLVAFARASLVTGVRYSNTLLRLSIRWLQVRNQSKESIANRAVLTSLHCAGARIAARIPRPGVTCSTFVFDALTFALDDDRLGVCLDGPLNGQREIGPSCELSRWLTTPGDLRRSPIIDRLFDVRSVATEARD